MRYSDVADDIQKWIDQGMRPDEWKMAEWVARLRTKITDADYLAYDPFEGDRDVDIRCRTTKIVTVRKPQKCHGLDYETHGHAINPGERARYEQAIVDGKWGRYYVCLGCMNKWLTEHCGLAL